MAIELKLRQGVRVFMGEIIGTPFALTELEQVPTSTHQSEAQELLMKHQVRNITGEMLQVRALLLANKDCLLQQENGFPRYFKTLLDQEQISRLVKVLSERFSEQGADMSNEAISAETFKRL
jgi:hypothetical protein